MYRPGVTDKAERTVVPCGRWDADRSTFRSNVIRNHRGELAYWLRGGGGTWNRVTHFVEVILKDKKLILFGVNYQMA